MFFRMKKTPSGQVLQLVESYRAPAGDPRHRVVVSLGSLSIPRSCWSRIAGAVTAHIYGRADLFSEDDSDSIRNWIDFVKRRIAARSPSTGNVTEAHVDGVVLDKVEHGTTCELGPELVALDSWNRLQLGEHLRRVGFNELQSKTAAISVINRLVSSVSEHRLETWLAQTALPELLGDNVLRQGDDHYYRVSDKLLSCQASIESHLRQRQGTLFNLDRTVLLYDLTNTHFEGLCKSNPKARYGKNKQKRNDCLQVVVGMVFDGDGFELGHQVFEGNKSDSKSLTTMIESLENSVDKKGYGIVNGGAKPIVILDGGIATRENLTFLRSKGFSYLVNDSRRSRIRYEKQFAEQDGFEVVYGREKKPPVLVRLIEEDFADDKRDKRGEDIKRERLVLCKSTARGEKERAIVSNAEKRFLASLEKLSARVRSGKLVDSTKVERSIGRIQARHTRVQRYYEVKISGTQRADDVVWTRKDAEMRNAEQLYGCYVLRTDIDTLSKVELWQLYITLTRAEDGFQALKRDLGLRPNRHQKELRVDAHIFITVLAYQLMCYIMRSLEAKGENRDWDTLRRVLQTHCYTTIVLPTRNGTVYRIRKAGQPEECQRSIYEALGIDWKNLPTTKMRYESGKPNPSDADSVATLTRGTQHILVSNRSDFVVPIENF